MSEPGLESGNLELPVISDDGILEQLVLLGKALSDPIRVRMLGLLASGRGCCGLPPVSAMAVPGEGESEGICVCELQTWLGLGQSKVSYHLKILRDAGLIAEDVRGKWTFYTLNQKAARQLLDLLGRRLEL